MRGVLLVFLVACGDNSSFVPDGGPPDAHPIDAGPEPAMLALSPLVHHYGSVDLGCTAPLQDFTVTNNGGRASSPVTVEVLGADATAFAISSDACAAAQLSPGASCTFVVGAAPTAAGDFSATVQVSGGGSVAAALDVTGTSGGDIVGTPSLLMFPSTVVGTSSTAMSVTFKNPGCSSWSGITAQLGGTDPSSFAVTGDTCSGHALASGASCAFSVTFVPTAAGTRTATLNVSTWLLIVVPLTGEATPKPAKLAITPTLQDFGTAVIGCGNDPTVPFTVTNIGGIMSGSISTMLGGADAASFPIGSDACNGATLAPGASCITRMAFHPTSTGSRAATLTASATLSFGTVAVGSTSSAMTTTLTNTGCMTSPALAVALAGNDPTSFAIGNDTCTGAMVAPGQTCSVGVAFAPTATGARSANLSISGGAASTSAGLAGTGQ